MLGEFTKDLLISAVLCVLLAGPVLAHKVNIFAYSEGGTVFAEGYFPDGQPVANSTIVVYDAAGNQLLQGQTDSQGQFQFARPQSTELTLEIDAGMGHKNTFVLKTATDHE